MFTLQKETNVSFLKVSMIIQIFVLIVFGGLEAPSDFYSPLSPLRGQLTVKNHPGIAAHLMSGIVHRIG
jgi:hypothetical protein